MFMIDDLVISKSDAEVLALMFGDRAWRERAALDCAGALMEVLQTADIVPDERFPGDRVAMGAAIVYEESGERKRISLTRPGGGAPEAGLVPVLSPVGTALMGRRVGEVVDIPLPNGRSRTVKIVSVECANTAASEAGDERRVYA
jgi:regulator of nucleoside diphosphate kinase